LRSSDKTEAEQPQASTHGRTRINAGNTGRRPAPRQKLFREKVFWIFKKLFGAQTIVCEKKHDCIFADLGL
jgi:hypothetical protein